MHKNNLSKGMVPTAKTNLTSNFSIDFIDNLMCTITGSMCKTKASMDTTPSRVHMVFTNDVQDAQYDMIQRTGCSESNTIEFYDRFTDSNVNHTK